MVTATYRVYSVARTGKITAGEWLEALGDDDARRKARELCNAATPTVEVWQGGRFVAKLDCGPAQHASR